MRWRFAWDRTAGKLYLDLNRNLDLTDDPAGVFSCQERSRGLFPDLHQYSSAFENAGRRPPRRWWTSISTATGMLNCTAAMRSFWQGKVTLQGEEWQVGLLGTPSIGRASSESGNLLLRPWSERNKPFSLYSGSLEAFPFSRKLFVGEPRLPVAMHQRSPGRRRQSADAVHGASSRSWAN